ncbi:MAG: polyribonucleotide nucleotidyltransferase [Rickettsiales bacterium]|jgi:polyribonucleotide nucleotidyltransferase|nr:polyribonucleotide nucleotidyltransferase [Rickettsiales bacterium]
MFGIFGKKTMFNITEKKIKWAGRDLVLQTGKLARQATGAVLATYGETSVLATCVASKEAKPDQGFFPLTVNYMEKFAAGGKIPGSFRRREGQPSTDETLTSRLIDRPIRPLFHKNFKNEVQVVATVFNYDKENSPDIVAMIAASAAISVSGIPFNGPIGAARVGYKDGRYIINPTKKELVEGLDLNLVVAGTGEGVLMVESEAAQLSEDVMLGAVEEGFKSFQPIIKLIGELSKDAGKEKWPVPETPEVAKVVDKIVRDTVAGELESAFAIKDKLARQDAVRSVEGKAKEAVNAQTGSAGEHDQLTIASFESLSSEIMRGAVLSGQARLDGRDAKTVRPIECEVGIFNRNHGSALFTRGETQAVVTATIGVKDDEQLEDDLDGIRGNPYMLHYNFPPYSVGECGRMGAPGRREIGHGKLAWRANHAVLPSHEDFPYTIRVVSDVTESNGSSSMATTCGASLAMMDAGIPVKAPVAGIAMGLVKESDKFVILSDIMGDEDHLGDMDFKVAGTKDGITALQMDIKITSITFEIMRQALAQALDGRRHILGEMAKAIKEPRNELSKYAPSIRTININPKKIREVIGSGGSVIRGITEKTQTKIDIDDDGSIKVSGLDGDAIQAAIDIINDIVAEPEIGKAYEVKVLKILDFGAVVSFGKNFEGLIHISEMSDKRIEKVEDIVKVGDVVKAVIVEPKDGKTRLSIKRVK